MRKFLKGSLSLVLALTIILSSAIVGLSELDLNGLFIVKVDAANSGTCGENLTWTLDDNGTLTISGTGSMTDYAYYLDDPWEELKIISVIIDSGVTSIGNEAFSSCKKLASVTISDTVETIGDEAFQSCSALSSITIPGSVKSIGNRAFAHCRSLSSINFCEGIETIDIFAFYECDSLTSVVLPESIKIIDGCAFYYCRNLESITIPDSVTYIDSLSFYGTAYYYDVNNWENGFLYINNHLVDVNNQNSGDCEIKEGIKTIAGEAFSYCSGITSLKIPDSVVNIGDFAFHDCSGLETIIIPDSVTNIGKSAFADCTNLKLIELSDNIKSLSAYTFQNCTALESIVIPEGVTSIGGWLFSGCVNLNDITIPDSVNNIDKGAFNNTAYYNNADNWEDDVLYLGDLLIEAKSTKIGHYDIKAGTKKIVNSAFFSCDKITSVAIPNTVTAIGKYAFEKCKALATITIPGNVSTIGKYAFADCINLASVTLSEGITSIGEGVFENCDLLSSITIPASVTTIEDYAFGYDIGTDKINGFVVCGNPGTIAEDYANKNGFLFVDAQHTHISTDWKTIKEPTLDTSGVKIKECSVCKTALETEVIPQLTPAAPKVSVSLYDYRVSLTWKKVAGADKYIVYRREYQPEVKGWSDWTRIEDNLTKSGSYDNGYYSVDKYNDINSYSDRSTKTGVWYIYTVRAANEAGRGPYIPTEKLYFLAAPELTSLEHNNKAITFKWEKVQGATGYIVYRRDLSSWNNWKKIATTKNTTYVDKSAEVGVCYKYTVRAYYGSYRSHFDEAGREITILTTPKLKSVTCSKDGSIVKWGEVKGTDFYYVYRRDYDAKTQKWSGWTRVSSGVSSESYVDKTAKSGKYYIYTVKAFARASSDYDVSGYDKTGLKIYYLATPSLKSATSTKAGVKLQWNKISGASGYKIYRKTGNNPWGEAIATVKGNSVVTYVDKTAKKGVTYTYTVRAYNGNTKSGYIPEGKTVKDKY